MYHFDSEYLIILCFLYCDFYFFIKNYLINIWNSKGQVREWVQEVYPSRDGMGIRQKIYARWLWRWR